MVKIESHYLIQQGKTKVWDYLKELIKSYGFYVGMEDINDGCKSIYIALKGEASGKTLLYCGYMDTVRSDNMTLLSFVDYCLF